MADEDVTSVMATFVHDLPLWTRPHGGLSDEEWIAECGDSDADIAIRQWLDHIQIPMTDAVRLIEWPENLRALVDHVVIQSSDGFGIGTSFDLPAWAQALDMTMADVLAARTTLVRLRVIWYTSQSTADPEGHPTRGFIGLNFRFHVWNTERATIERVFAEESARHRRARYRSASTKDALWKPQIPETIRWHVFERDNFTCRYCGAKGVPLTLDHVIPHARGGGSDTDNLVACCRPCNSSKGTRTLDEWSGEE